jgi:hypothetical protein
MPLTYIRRQSFRLYAARKAPATTPHTYEKTSTVFWPLRVRQSATRSWNTWC